MLQSKSRRIFLCLALVMTVMNCQPQPSFANWQKPDQPPAAGQLTALLAHPFSNGRVLTASTRQIFLKTGTGSWKNFSHDPGGAIRKLLYLKEMPRDFFILTQKSISRCNIESRRCSEIYRASQIRGKSVLSFAVDPEDRGHWFLGTDKGLFESDDAGKTWFGFGHLKKPVSLLRFWKGRFFVAVGSTLYESEDGSHFDSVFSLQDISGDSLTDDSDSFSDEDGEDPFVWAPLYHELLLPETAAHPFWLATREGAFESRDEGKSWQALPESGLRSNEIRYLAYSKKTQKLFAGTAKGVYAYLPERKRWQELYQGLENENIQGLAVLGGENETLATLSPAGFFSTLILPDQIKVPAAGELAADRKMLFQELLRLEPSMQEIQRAAIRYANVRNGKIKRWQTGSRLAALLPSLSFGKDFSRGNSIDIDRRGTNDPDLYITGPDDVSRGWDFDVNWDLGDFIYSTAQTSIDSREKLMVELRNDILAEITRLYYERRRLELEIIFTPAASEQEHFEKLLRLDELASLLDGMTSGYFTKKLNSVYTARPDLTKIWDYQASEKAHEE